MAESVKRYRQPAAWVVLGVSVVYIVMSLVRGGYLLSQGTVLTEVARAIGGSSLSVVMVLLCLAAALSCVLVKPVTSRGRTVVRLAAVMVTTAALLELVFLVVSLFGVRGGIFAFVLDILGGVLEIAVKFAAAQILWGAARSAHEPERAALPTSAPSIAVVEEPRQQASWTAEQAAGAVWTRAGDAASGAAATTWGHPGQQASGWKLPDDASPELPAAEHVSRGPWATAGELATGEAPAEPAAQDAPDKQSGDGSVSWAPARHDS